MKLSINAKQKELEVHNMSRFRWHALAVPILLGLIMVYAADNDRLLGYSQDLLGSQDNNVKADLPKVVVESLVDHESTYITTVQLMNGAHIRPILGAGPQDAGTNGCRGWVNRFESMNVSSFTQKSSANSASVIISGSFHDDHGRPAFPLRIKTWRATYGFACSASEGINDLLMLTIRDQEKRAYISSFSLAAFNNPNVAPDVVVGLKPNFPKNPTTRLGRNYVGLANPYNQGFGTVIFVTSKSLTQSEAVAILKTKGCPADQIMQLDGSTVAQLSMRNTQGTWIHLITSSIRRMPQAFLIEG